MRQIVLDIETTGLDTAKGNRVIEIGCIEIINRKLTGSHYHQYINPERDIEPGALAVHNITRDFLADKPVFSAICRDFIEYVHGAELVIHNAPFDVGFLDYELNLDRKKHGLIKDHCSVVDTLVLAKHMHPGSANSLDALSRRYGVNLEREHHGALVDARILAEVYLLMTGGQTGLQLETESSDQIMQHNMSEIVRQAGNASSLPVIRATDDELNLHHAYLEFLDARSGGKCLWTKKAVNS